MNVTLGIPRIKEIINALVTKWDVFFYKKSKYLTMLVLKTVSFPYLKYQSARSLNESVNYGVS